MVAFLISLISFAGLIAFHSVTNFATGFRVLHVIPVWLAARLGGWRVGMAMVLLTSLVLPGIDMWVGSVAEDELIRSAIYRFIAFTIVMSLVAHVEDTLRQMKEIAAHDELTGALNRRALVDFAPVMLSDAKAKHDPVVVAAIDCDGFKNLNDQFGHERGDRVLQELSSILENETRDSDIVARIGGDEFAVVMQGSTVEEARHLLRRVQSRFRDVTREGGHEMTVSIGLAAMEDDSMELNELIREADRDMYRRKRRKQSA